MSEFVCSPQDSADFNPQGKIPSGGKGTWDGDDQPPFSEHRRTHSPNAVPELMYDDSIKKPSGESDQGFGE